MICVELRRAKPEAWRVGRVPVAISCNCCEITLLRAVARRQHAQEEKARKEAEKAAKLTEKQALRAAKQAVLNAKKAAKGLPPLAPSGRPVLVAPIIDRAGSSSGSGRKEVSGASRTRVVILPVRYR